jgi:uncharacterized protein (TIGR04255 family)
VGAECLHSPDRPTVLRNQACCQDIADRPTIDLSSRSTQSVMSQRRRFTIDPKEEFPRLQFPPSIEAVIHWQAYAENFLDESILQRELLKRLPEYPNCLVQNEVGIESAVIVDGRSEVNHWTRWNGFRLQGPNHRYVAQVSPTGVAFSRLEPYENWDSFQTEALRFWDIFIELAEPTSIQRLGVRYINRMPLNSGEWPSEYLHMAPTSLPGLDLPAESFFYQETFRVPETPYFVNWVRTVQPQSSSPADGPALIVDIDVFATELIDVDRESLIDRLNEMRWIKNKIFFSCITPMAQERFGG